MEIVLPKHLGFELPELRAVLPCITRQGRFVARLFDKCLSIPPPFGRHLGKQQTSLPSLFDDETMAADFDLVERRYGFEGSEDRQLDINLGQFRCGDGWKSGVCAAGRDGALRDDPRERLVRLKMADAAAELTALVERDEGSR